MSIDPRLMERRKSVAEDNAKKNVGRLLKFLLLVVVVGASVWVVFSPWLSVKQVLATGIRTSSANSVLAEHRVRAGTPMILIDVSRVESLLLQDPWVAEANIRREWPDTVLVDVVERNPAAWVRTEGGWTRRAGDGVGLPSEPEPDAEMVRIDMPHIPDSEATTSIELTGALEFATALPADLRAGTSITYQDNELWATVSNYQVRLGRSDDMTEKALSLAALLEERPPDGSILTLIAPTNPAWKAPSAADDGQNDSSDTTAADDQSGNNSNDDS
jgi:cell division protein FtsQ